MNSFKVPVFLKDAKDLLSEQGFATGDTWYHGTSSALVDSIKQQGLKRSGDKALNAATQKTMATIEHSMGHATGRHYKEPLEPVFLTQSKELAFYWAAQRVRARVARFGGNEEPRVLAVKLPQKLNAQVKPDVGAASLLLLKEGENFMAYLAGIYQENNLSTPEIDLMNADRLEYLHTLGMAYFDADIEARHLQLVTE